MKKYFHACFPALILFAVVCAAPAQAGGLYLYELGGQDVGLAAAGNAARAEDASTVFTNPAGMTRLTGSNVTLAAAAVYAHAEFDPGAGTGPQTGDDGGNAVGWVPGGSFFFSQQVGKDFAVGIGAFSYFGGAVDYNDAWVGRYYVQQSTLAGLTLMPAVAYRVNDMLSVGAGLNVMYGMFETEKAVHNIEPGVDGTLKLKDNEWGYGANIGALLEFDTGTRIGATYLSEVKLDFNDVPSFENLGPGLSTVLAARGLDTASIDLGITVPQCVMVSFYQKLGDRFALLGNVGWQDWSSFGKVEVGVNTADPVSLVTESNFKDTWHGALGAQFKPIPRLLLSAGFSYDSPMFSNAYRPPSLPIGATCRYGLGTQYALNDKVKIGLDYEFSWSGDLEMTRSSSLAGDLTGEYGAMYTSIIAMNVELKL